MATNVLIGSLRQTWKYHRQVSDHLEISQTSTNQSTSTN